MPNPCFGRYGADLPPAPGLKFGPKDENITRTKYGVCNPGVRGQAAYRAFLRGWRAEKRDSMASQIWASRQTVSKRSISWMPVGEVTLISVK